MGRVSSFVCFLQTWWSPVGCPSSDTCASFRLFPPSSMSTSLTLGSSCQGLRGEVMTSRIGRHLVDILHRSPPIVDFLRLEPSPSTLPPHTHTHRRCSTNYCGWGGAELPACPSSSCIKDSWPLEKTSEDRLGHMNVPKELLSGLAEFSPWQTLQKPGALHTEAGYASELGLYSFPGDTGF